MKKQLRVTLDFEIESDESAIQTKHRIDDPEYLERQRRLFRAIQASEVTLDLLFRYFASVAIENMHWKAWRKLFFGVPDLETEDILKPVINALDATDRQWFGECIQEGVFSENTEECMDGFSVTLAATEQTWK